MITTHVLDTAIGRPAAGVAIALERSRDGGWEAIGNGETDGNGRLRTLVRDGAPLEAGTYRLIFDTGRYFESQRRPTFYPRIIVVFETRPGEAHYHVPLLVGPFGYTTYRGS